MPKAVPSFVFEVAVRMSNAMKSVCPSNRSCFLCVCVWGGGGGGGSVETLQRPCNLTCLSHNVNYKTLNYKTILG